MDGLHNVFQVTPNIYSGSGPEGVKAIAALAKLGIKTIISVDGAMPNVDAARKAGLAYVHLPIGYGGVPRERVVQLAKAMKERPGPFYIHCHHGKHRGPAAAAIAQLCADDRCTTEQALKLLTQAGTDARYKGLFESVKNLDRPTPKEIAQAAPLVEALRATGLVQAMVSIDRHFDHLKLARNAGWKSPKDHPDLDPPHEALQLLELYRELRREPAMQKKPADFQEWLHEGQGIAAQVEAALRAAKKDKNADNSQTEKLFQRLSANCNSCHAKYRD